jgi:hypothetical protein
LLGDEGSGNIIDVDDREDGVEFGAFDAIDIDRSTVSGVALIVCMRWAVAEGVLVGGIARAARGAVMKRAMGLGGVEAFGATMGMRGTCRFRVAEAGWGA